MKQTTRKVRDGRKANPGKGRDSQPTQAQLPTSFSASLSALNAGQVRLKGYRLEVREEKLDINHADTLSTSGAPAARNGTAVTDDRQAQAVKGAQLGKVGPAMQEEDSPSREKPHRVNISLTPSVRREFEAIAAAHGISLTEYLRRAGFAALNDPSILRSEFAAEAERAYKASLGPSRWSRDEDLRPKRP